MFVLLRVILRGQSLLPAFECLAHRLLSNSLPTGPLVNTERT